MRKIMKSADLLAFVRAHGCCKDTMPQPRHFGMQYGIYFLVNGSYHPIRRRTLGPGEYCLYSIARPHPSFVPPPPETRKKVKALLPPQPCCDAIERRRTIEPREFEKLKVKFESRCGVCGSPEGSKNFKNRTLVTRLEMGHCDPRRPLTSPRNCIPMCQYCNRAYKDKFVFDCRGVVRRGSTPGRATLPT